MKYVCPRRSRLSPCHVRYAIRARCRIVGASDGAIDISFGRCPLVGRFLDSVAVGICSVEPFFHCVLRVGAVGKGGGPVLTEQVGHVFVFRVDVVEVVRHRGELKRAAWGSKT